MIEKPNQVIAAQGPLPPPDFLRGIVLDAGRDRPLHAQLRNSLENLILTKFEDKARFYSETQIIAELGLSQGTVRRALADLVVKGFLERRAARGTIVHKPSVTTGLLNLAVFLPQWTSLNLSRQFQLINIECLKRGIALQLFFTHQGEHLVKAYEQIKFKPQEGGIVLLANSSQANAELSAAFDDRGYRYLFVDVPVSDPKQFAVVTSNRAIMEIGMDHLVELGHRKIALLVNEPEENENVKQRVVAFEKYALNSAIPLETQIHHCAIQTWEDSSAAVVRVMGKIWNSQNRPTAIFTISDYGAVTAITWLLRQEVQVPQQISVIGADGSEIGHMIRPALTTVAQPFEKINQTIFELLEDPNATPGTVSLNPHLLIRESVAPPPQVRPS